MYFLNSYALNCRKWHRYKQWWTQKKISVEAKHMSGGFSLANSTEFRDFHTNMHIFNTNSEIWVGAKAHTQPFLGPPLGTSMIKLKWHISKSCFCNGISPIDKSCNGINPINLVSKHCALVQMYRRLEGTNPASSLSPATGGAVFLDSSGWSARIRCSPHFRELKGADVMFQQSEIRDPLCPSTTAVSVCACARQESPFSVGHLRGLLVPGKIPETIRECSSLKMTNFLRNTQAGCWTMASRVTKTDEGVRGLAGDTVEGGDMLRRRNPREGG
jgi:hypothetical protein